MLPLSWKLPFLWGFCFEGPFTWNTFQGAGISHCSPFFSLQFFRDVESRALRRGSLKFFPCLIQGPILTVPVAGTPKNTSGPASKCLKSSRHTAKRKRKAALLWLRIPETIPAKPSHQGPGPALASAAAPEERPAGAAPPLLGHTAKPKNPATLGPVAYLHARSQAPSPH